MLHQNTKYVILLMCTLSKFFANLLLLLSQSLKCFYVMLLICTLSKFFANMLLLVLVSPAAIHFFVHCVSFVFCFLQKQKVSQLVQEYRQKQDQIKSMPQALRQKLVMTSSSAHSLCIRCSTDIYVKWFYSCMPVQSNLAMYH